MRIIGSRQWWSFYDPHKGQSTWVEMVGGEFVERHRYYLDFLKESNMDEPVVNTGEGSHDLPAVSLSIMLDAWPEVNRIVNEHCWSSGKAKGKRCLMFFCEPGACRVLFKVEYPPLKCSFPGHDLDKTLDAFQLALSTNAVVWEADGYVAPPRARRGKKAS